MGETKIDLEQRRFASGLAKAQLSKQIQFREMSNRLRQLKMEADDREKYDRRDHEDNSVKLKRMREIKLLEEKLKYLNNYFYEME